MASNLKLKEEEFSLNDIIDGLLADSVADKVNALQMIDEDNIGDVLEYVKLCAFDYRSQVRAHAYKALKYTNPATITALIQDALRDEDRHAFKVARELFHNAYAY